MSGEPSRNSGRSTDRLADPSEQACEADAPWPSASGALAHDAPASVRERLARLARALEADVIPRLVLAHRPGLEAAPSITIVPDEAEVLAFVNSVLSDDPATLNAGLDRLRARGMRVDTLYVDLFAPAARHLGTMWEDDTCDFSTVTVALGRLQRLLRELSPAFGAEIEHPTHGRRALFVQPQDEQHSFGLSMVAEFFRRDGWDVLGGVGGSVPDPAAKVRDEWIDVMGFSIGSDLRLAWLKACITSARAAARNPDMVVLVGGPLFRLNPELTQQVGADGTANDGREAPLLAERLLAKRVKSR